MEILVVWIAACFVVAIIADRKGRSGVGFFFLSVLISPILGILFALVVTPNRQVAEQAKLAAGNEKKCPFCAELIKAEAAVCRYCGHRVPLVESLYVPRAPASPTKSGPGTAIFLAIAGLAVVGAVVYFVREQDAHASAESTPPARQPDSVTPINSSPAISPPTPWPDPTVPPPAWTKDVAYSQAAALAKYPALGVKGSPMNRLFLSRLEQWKTTRDPRLSSSTWPEVLAGECAGNP